MFWIYVVSKVIRYITNIFNQSKVIVSFLILSRRYTTLIVNLSYGLVLYFQKFDEMYWYFSKLFLYRTWSIGDSFFERLIKIWGNPEVLTFSRTQLFLCPAFLHWKLIGSCDVTSFSTVIQFQKHQNYFRIGEFQISILFAYTRSCWYSFTIQILW